MSGEALRQEIRKTAEERARQVLAEAQAKAEQIIAEGTAEAKRIMDTRIREAVRDLGQLERAEAAKARMDCTRRLLSINARYVEEAFQQAESVVNNLPADDPRLYKSVLTNFIIEAMEGLGGGRLTAVVKGADRALVEGILRAISSDSGGDARVERCSIAKEPLDASGGVILRTEDNRVYFVNTFESRFVKARDEFRAKVAETLARRV